jgi:hypothetical protein
MARGKKPAEKAAGTPSPLGDSTRFNERAVPLAASFPAKPPVASTPEPAVPATTTTLGQSASWPITRSSTARFPESPSWPSGLSRILAYLPSDVLPPHWVYVRHPDIPDSFNCLPIEVVNIVGHMVFEMGNQADAESLKLVSRAVRYLTADATHKVKVVQVGKHVTKEQEEEDWKKLLGSGLCWWTE